ncbi:hypothetical protein FD755_015545 [Muntiacus reevesi]|uniref:Prothymosin alpha n=1 Tax=Muntiacus reevesi TaxID=9886 RepID=A0A5N3XGM0_MUNRE|nr:hypothetical protein FD755_015545 [Muntiacus reevesi]
MSGSSLAQPPPTPPPRWTPAASSPEFSPSCFLSSLLHDFTGPIVPVQPWTPAPGSLPRTSRSCGGDREWGRGPANGNGENEEDGEQEADSVVGEEEEEVGEGEEEEGDGEEEGGDEDEESEAAVGKAAAEDDGDADTDAKKRKMDEDD